MFDHLGFGVTDYAASKSFFLKALEPLGVGIVMEGEHGLGIGSKGKPSLWLFQTSDKPLPMHIAFTAETRQQVEDFYRAALAAGGKDNGAPGIRAHYHPNYYGAFVIGPDGHNVEAVCHRHEAQLRTSDAPPPMVILTTERLVLRQLEPHDLESLYALYRDPEMREFYPDGTRTLAETKDELDWFLNGHPRHPTLGLWATIERSSGAFLGRCGLLPWQIDGTDEVELAFMIDKRRWREGLATEAARGIIAYARDELKLQRLICLVMPGNEASAGVATKVGMRFEREYSDEFGLCHIYSLRLHPPAA